MCRQIIQHHKFSLNKYLLKEKRVQDEEAVKSL